MLNHLDSIKAEKCQETSSFLRRLQVDSQQLFEYREYLLVETAECMANGNYSRLALALEKQEFIYRNSNRSPRCSYYQRIIIQESFSIAPSLD